jgi:DNA mismatch repair protein PMS2
VRFKNNGLDSIEVQDNGHGISPNDYETIGMSNLAERR